MKATFKNIGPIEQAELELGDLTIIAGQNNTGKTYLVYTLYGFLKLLEQPMLFRPRAISPNALARIAADLKSSGKATISFDEYQKISRKSLKNISKIFSKEYISEIFSSPNGEFKGANFGLGMQNVSVQTKQDYTISTRADDLSLGLSFENGSLMFKLLKLNSHEQDSVSMDKVVDGVDLLIMKTIRDHHPKPFILSAERFGISLFYKELDFTKNRLVEELQKLPNDKDFDPFRFLESQSARYAKPIKDNIDFTRDLERIQKKKSQVRADKLRSVSNVMGGRYKVVNDEIRFISTKRGDSRFDIPLHLASSSARGVADLYFYLKHIAEPGQLLIIDEPESHLSPTNQMMMARLLVFCVNSGLKVLITTHSDYLIKEINNLIMLHGNFQGKEEFLQRHTKDYTNNDQLSPGSVRAYTCKDGKLTQCPIDLMGIDMPVFDKAIDGINKISNELGLAIESDAQQS